MSTTVRPRTTKVKTAENTAGKHGPRWSTVLPTVVLLGAAAYFLMPVLWVVTSMTKTTGELFTSPAFTLGSGFAENLGDLFAYEGGMFPRWMANSFLYSMVGAGVATLVASAAGYALALYVFPGRKVFLGGLAAGLLLPGITLTIPQYMLFAEMDLVNTYWSVLIPLSITPFGIYLAFVFAKASVPTELIESARVDGSSEFRTFRSIGLPMMLPGIVTVFLLQFIGAWNNFLLPYLMITDQKLQPITVAMFLMLNRGGSEPILYHIAITGAALAIVPVVIFVLVLQRFWRLDLISGSLK